MSKQNIIWLENSFAPIEDCIRKSFAKRIFLVCDNSLTFLEIGEYLPKLSENTNSEIVKFSDLESNPNYISVVKGVKAFNESKSDFILAIGGGSAIDTAKCIKLYALAQLSERSLPQNYPANNIPLAAMPTTAGTGSESTRFSVVYLNGKKQSVEDNSILPSYVFLDERALKTLPEYQKKATMLDALSHSIESYWSVNSTDKSKELSQNAIKIIFASYKKYLRGDAFAAREMLKAANLAGQAINISKTTAAHAMSYKLTSVFGISHGHAAFICLIGSIRFINDRSVMQNVVKELSETIGGDLEKSVKDLYGELNLQTPVCTDERVIGELTEEVNTERLKNFPVKLNPEEIKEIYKKILGGALLK